MSTTYDHLKGKIVINAVLEGKPTSGPKIAEVLSAIQKRSTSSTEPGCLTFRTTRFEDRFAVFEEYANAAAVSDHHALNKIEVAGALDDLLIKASVLYYEEFCPEEN